MLLIMGTGSVGAHLERRLDGAVKAELAAFGIQGPELLVTEMRSNLLKAGLTKSVPIRQPRMSYLVEIRLRNSVKFSRSLPFGKVTGEAGEAAGRVGEAKAVSIPTTYP